MACLLLSRSARDDVHAEYKPDRNKSAARLPLDITRRSVPCRETQRGHSTPERAVAGVSAKWFYAGTHTRSAE